MKKISLAVIGCFFSLFGAFAQIGERDTAVYKQKKLSLQEVNFVSAYYRQSGNNSAVTGGTGTEDLTDIANTLDLIMAKTDKHNKLYTWALELGIDHYTSASSDNIDPSTMSGPSSHDTRIYPSLAWSVKDTRKNTFGLSASYSTEFDYKSYGVGVNYSKSSNDNNREFAIHLQSYIDRWTLIYPVELRPPGGGFSGHGGGKNDPLPNTYKPRDSYSASFSYSQVVNRRLQLLLLMDLIYQHGLLATDYQRVYFADNSEQIENLPGTRFKLPLGLRANYFFGDRVILRAYYRYYQDDWNIIAHTVGIEVPVKINPYLSVSPFYRFYLQNPAGYFAPYRAHTPGETFYTSDYDLSAFNSQFFGAGLRYVPQKGVLGIAHWSVLEIRYGHYLRSNGLQSDIISLNAGFR
jgi:uncharacterized protein DUF3570